MEPEDSLPHPQEPSNCPYPQPDRSSRCRHPTSGRSILKSSHLRLGISSGLLTSGFPTKNIVRISPLPIRFTCPVHRSLPDLITHIFDNRHVTRISKNVLVSTKPIWYCVLSPTNSSHDPERHTGFLHTYCNTQQFLRLLVQMPRKRARLCLVLRVRCSGLKYIAIYSVFNNCCENCGICN